MYRRDLIDVLLERPYTLSELAERLESNPRTVEHDLHHLFKTLRHMAYREVIEPARCRDCGFTFKTDKLRKPGKCPQCRGTWIHPPRVWIESAEPGP